MAADKVTGAGGEGAAGSQDQAHTGPNVPRGSDPASGDIGMHSATPKNSGGQPNPSAPGDTGTTPGSNSQ